MVKRAPDYFPKHIDQSIPGSMKYAADVLEGVVLVDLGAPALADTDYFMAGGSISASTAFAQSDFTLTNTKVDAKYGRNVTVNAITGFTTDTVRSVTVTGRDYLGQVMTETIQMLSTTAVTIASGVKAFKWVDGLSVLSSTDAAQAQTINLGFGDVLGLPYKTLKWIAEYVNVANGDPLNLGTTGTSVAPLAASLTSTATTADVRGTYDPNLTLDGTAGLRVHCYVDRNNLHGSAQA